MKKTAFLLVSTLFMGFFACAQNTTQEEYNYIKTGILMQAQSGMDVGKRGYKLVDLAVDVKKDAYSFSFAGLFRENGTVAGIWVVAVSHAFGNKYSLCIPLDTAELIAMYESDVKKWDAPMARAYANTLTDLFTAVMTSHLESTLSKKK